MAASSSDVHAGNGDDLGDRATPLSGTRLLPAHVVLPEPPPLPPGVLLASMADLGDGDGLRHQIYELNRDCSADIPDRDEFFTYDQYHRRRFKAEGFRADATVLAVADDELVGMCAISQRPGRDWAFIEMTGVRRPLRRLGLAKALKVEAIRRARGAGATVVRTIHHPYNAAIINANRALGFVDANFTLG